MWNDLASADGDVARGAIGGLSAAPEQTTAFLQGRLKPILEPDAAFFPALIGELAGSVPAQRSKAAERLKLAGAKAGPALYKALQNKPSLELRREIETLLEAIGEYPIAPERLRQQRSIQILERIGTPEAQRLLQALAGAEYGPEIVRDAHGALESLAQLRKVRPTKVLPDPSP